MARGGGAVVERVVEKHTLTLEKEPAQVSQGKYSTTCFDVHKKKKRDGKTQSLTKTYVILEDSPEGHSKGSQHE